MGTLGKRIDELDRAMLAQNGDGPIVVAWPDHDNMGWTLRVDGQEYGHVDTEEEIDAVAAALGARLIIKTVYEKEPPTKDPWGDPDE